MTDSEMKTYEDLIGGEEGYRFYVYDDTTGEPVVKGYTLVGNPTIGWGRLLTKAAGLTQEEGNFLRQGDILRRKAALSEAFPWFEQLSDGRKAVLVSMAYNIGVEGLKGFHLMVAAIERGDFLEAAAQMQDSHWGKDQLPARAERAAKIMFTGEV